MMGRTWIDEDHANWLAWRAWGTPEELAAGAHKEGLSIARTLQLMARGWIPIAFTWADQERVVREMIILQKEQSNDFCRQCYEVGYCTCQ